MLGTLEPNRTERKPRSRGKGFIILVSLLLFLAAVIVGGGLYWRWATGATGPQTRVTVEIPQGATGSQVADILKQKDVIHSPLAFRLLAKFRGFSGGFKAGRYPLTTNMSVEAVLAALKKGPVRIPSIPVLLPEGWRITQIAPRVQQRLHIPAKTFLQVATSGRFSLPGYLPTGAKNLEGFLFPNTYNFEQGSSAPTVITWLLAQFKKQGDGLDWTKLRSLGLTTRYQVVVVASMIEREARYPQDRAKIATVIYNRLKRGMPLEVDATIQYAKGNWNPITEADKGLRSPYNTYLHTGLPPTPIANPGLASLNAALSPAKASYLYYLVTDCKGHTSFASTYDQFVRLEASRPSC